MNIKAESNVKTNIKIKLNLEPAFQTIYLSSIFISFCVAVVFTTTIESFNWGTVLFLILALILFYLKKETYLRISEEKLQLCYFAGIKDRVVELDNITSVVISNPGGEVTLTTDQKTIVFYLNKHSQQLFLQRLEKYNLNINVVN
ncbi:hypothetical protein BKP56_09450 [Marinilactibacillus sp. 15R]|uniref:PH domain-containing protein n=1 Tax=Marinilactibacillus piezotolerans TaxID=258723 RepID=A0A1I3URN4_9LACT|nr:MULTISPECIES: EbsA family protein [Marinilactibacillus]API89464.1 hypothetical protein BKP56_09450 [Marinilactibacillus sp. 15R]SFJ84447.1 hypothetical protein SAMN04488569_100163 [Marinilactibacillus piezotolerans]